MKYILSISNAADVRTIVTHDLQELGIIFDLKKNQDLATNFWKISSRENSLDVIGTTVFGNSLYLVPSVVKHGYGTVPRFLTAAVDVLEQSIGVEGLFRKSGAVNRLKELRSHVEAGGDLADAHAVDVASLLKQFFRELPEPLLTSALYDVFVQCVGATTVDGESLCLEALLLACLLLPDANLATLRYLVTFLMHVAAVSEHNRMDASNLAVCLAPNLLYSEHASTATSTMTDNSRLEAEMTVIQLLIENAAHIGMVSDSIIERASLLNMCFTLTGESSVSGNAGVNEVGKVVKKKKKQRSGSLQGLVTSLSASFSRWRDRRAHNSSVVSDQSLISAVSDTRLSALPNNRALNVASEISLPPEIAATPKMMRKRRAGNEIQPFSTTKKQAILSSMPQRAVIGTTPFTSQLNDIDSDGILPATPKAATPRLHASKLILSAASMRVHRKHLTGKSGCFSPKTSKGGVRHSFRGFLRRLSGGKSRQVNNKSDVSTVDNSYSVTTSEQTPLTQSQHSARNITLTSCGHGHKQMTSMVGGDVSQLCAVNTVSLSPHVTHTTSAGHWLNCSLPTQARSRVYSEDGTPLGSTCLRRGRPNSLKSGLPSPLQRSLLICTDASVPDICEKEVAVIDTSPILSTYSVTSAVRENNGHSTRVISDRNGSTLVHCGSKVSLNAKMETSLDDSSHNQAFTESMLADPDVVDTADMCYTDSVDCDKRPDVSNLQPAVLLKSSPMQLLSSAESALKAVQSSTTSLDSAVDAENINENLSHLESELNIPRSFSKQSIISHDSGVGLADPQPVTYHSSDIDNQLSPKLDFSLAGSRCIELRSSVRRQSTRFNPNLHVTSDVRNLLFKAGVPLDAVNDKQEENAYKSLSDKMLQSFSNSKAMTPESDHMLEKRVSPLHCLNLPSSSTVRRRHSKLLPVLPISTNLLRVSCDQYSTSAKRYIADSSAAAAEASPAVSTGPPRIKSALLTPSFKQCLNDVSATSQLRSRLRSKPVKRLQSSPFSNHSPVNPLSPRHVTTSCHSTVAVPFDLDV